MPKRSRSDKPDESRLELTVERLTWGRRGQQDLGDFPVAIGAIWEDATWLLTRGDLPAGTRAYLVTLRDSTGQIRWEPGDNTEFFVAGRVFGELLRELHDGRRCRLALLPVCTGEVAEEMDRLYGPMHEKSWATQRKLANQYLKSIGMSHAFAIEPEEVGIHDPQYLGVDWWWLPKPALGHLLGLSWWFGCQGYVVRRSGPQALRECLAQTDERQALRDLVQTCHLFFEHAGEGESMLILSRSLRLPQVRAAQEAPRVRRAVRLASREARFTEWGPVDAEGRWWKKA